MSELTRSPICTVVGHVDHGKSSFLDYIRGTNIIDREAGAITQAIGASIVPFDIIRKKAGALMDQMKLTITIPSLLFIDTPGHAAFTNLRKRGGNLADIAVVVIDINEGIMPQTKEAIEILINYKTPFIIALNKIDLVAGFKTGEGSLLAQLAKQSDDTVQKLETKLYEVLGKINELFGLQCERFDRVDDFTKQVAMVPISAKAGIGISEVLMMIMGLAQRYLKDSLKIDSDAPAKGTILEVKEQKGMGTVLDVIIYDGTLKTNDTIVIGGLGGAIASKVRGLFEPMPLSEIMDKKAKFKPVKQAVAATGVRISAKDTEGAVAGMPLKACLQSQIDEVKEQVQAELEEVLIEKDNDGVIVKADSLGSLEALVGMLKAQGIQIRKATVGPISKADIIDVHACMEKDPNNCVILGFNSEPNEDAVHMSNSCGIKVISSNIIYHLIEEYEKFTEEQKKAAERRKMQALTPVGRIEIMSGYVFRQNNPAVCGVHVQMGKIKSGMNLMNSMGKVVAEAKSIQKEKESVQTASKDDEVALSMPNVTIGRQVKEGDILFSAITEDEFREYKDFKDCLTGDEKALLKQIAEIMRKDNPVWGI